MQVKSRRKAREAALRCLYEMEIGQVPLEDALEEVMAESALPPDLEEFAEGLITGVFRHRPDIDAKLRSALIDWELDRLAVVDKNVMRIAAYELLYMPGVPPAVSIDEAIEIAKKYSTADSGKFVNGVLGKVLKDSPKAQWDPQQETMKEEREIEPEEEIEEETVTDEERIQELARIGAWRLRAEDPS
ncbi:MAG: transcription antitermination factor NusB [Armatimonadetes bacterium]|nr:transcription antitermination factor NusB [Armatimonadota bacterium]